MGHFRFRRRIRIAPGLHLNIGKTGISTSLGGRGFTLNIGRGKTRTTVGLLGTGLSYSESSSTALRSGSSGLAWLLLIVLFVIFMLWWA